MAPDIYWVETPAAGRLAVLARPRGADWLPDEVAGWQRAGLTRVVSLLEADERAELGLDDEPATVRASGIRFDSLPTPDRGVPSGSRGRMLLVELADGVSAGERVGIHCRQGVGRSALLAAGVLVELGLTPADAFARIAAARGRDVPETDAQRDWVEAVARTREIAAR
jgi:protein-tyrosine phosphatase